MLQATLNKRDGLGSKETVPLRAGLPIIKVYLIETAQFGENNATPLNDTSHASRVDCSFFFAISQSMILKSVPHAPDQQGG